MPAESHFELTLIIEGPLDEAQKACDGLGEEIEELTAQFQKLFPSVTFRWEDEDE